MSFIYQNNLSSLKYIDLPLYKKLININTNTTFEVFSDNNLSNANLLDNRDKSIMYMIEPKKEIETKINELKSYSWHRYLYFFGIGNGYLYKKLLENKIHQKIRIIEPEIELIYIALNLIDLSNEIKSKRVSIHYSKEINFIGLLKQMDANEKIYFKTYNLFLNSSFYEKYQDEIIRTNSEFLKVFKHYINICGNDYADELKGLKHFINNMPTMLKNPSLKEFVSNAKVSNIAIIISTGPSLVKQLPLLKQIKDKATIISIDASFPILEKWDIKPDIVTSIERVEATSHFYKNTSKKFQKDIIFAISAVADEALLNSIKNGILQLSMRSTGNHYKFFGFDEWGYIGEGMSSANLAYELAGMIGFKTIILIGQDLAFGKNGKSHSKGHIFGEDETREASDIEYTIAYGGEKKIKTRKVWQLFRNGLEKQIARNIQAKAIQTINATEGGAKIQNTLESSFQTVCKELSNFPNKQKIQLKTLIKDEYQKNIEKMMQKLNEALDIGTSMQKRAKKLLIKISIEIKKDEKTNKKQNNSLIKDIKDIRTKYYEKSFQSFFVQLLSPLIMHVEFDICKINTLPENSEKEITYKNWQTILIHYEWLLRLVLNLEKILEIIEIKKREYEATPIKIMHEIHSETNRNKFLKSLQNFDKKSLKNIFGDRAIGFLITEENITNEEFFGYLKEFHQKYPKIKIRVFYYNIGLAFFVTKKLPFVEKIKVDSIEQIASMCLLFISQNKFKSISSSIFDKLVKYSNIAVIDYDESSKNIKIKNYFNMTTTSHPLLENPEYFGFTKEDTAICKNNLHKLLFGKYIENINNDDIYISRYFIIVPELYNNKEFRIYYNKYQKNNKRYEELNYLHKKVDY